MTGTAPDPLVLEVGAVRAVVTPRGAGLVDFSVGGRPYLGPGGVEPRVCCPAAGDADLGPDPAADWTVVSHDAATVALTVTVEHADAGGPLDVTTAYSVGDFGLGVIHAVTNRGERPVPVGVVARVRPRAGTEPAPHDRLSLNTAHRVTGSSTVAPLDGPVAGVTDGVALADLDLDATFGGAVPPPGKTHVTHVLEAPHGDGLGVWGDPEFAWVHVDTGDDAAALSIAPSTVLPGSPAPGAGAATVAVGETWSVTWGLQPFGCRQPVPHEPPDPPDPTAQETR